MKRENYSAWLIKSSGTINIAEGQSNLGREARFIKKLGHLIGTMGR